MAHDWLNWLIGAIGMKTGEPANYVGYITKNMPVFSKTGVIGYNCHMTRDPWHDELVSIGFEAEYVGGQGLAVYWMNTSHVRPLEYIYSRAKPRLTLDQKFVKKRRRRRR